MALDQPDCLCAGVCCSESVLNICCSSYNYLLASLDHLGSVKATNVLVATPAVQLSIHLRFALVYYLEASYTCCLCYAHSLALVYYLCSVEARWVYTCCPAVHVMHIHSGLPH